MPYLPMVKAMAPNAPIGATFGYAFQCRFAQDNLDFEEFMQNLWSAPRVKFRSVRTS